MKNMRMKNMPNKKAQIKMLETILVMFVLFVILALAMIFYFNAQRTSITQQASENKDAKAIEISQAVTALIELQCSQEDIRDFNCFDLYRLESMKNKIKNDNNLRINYYHEIFENSVIYVDGVYPISERITLYNRSLGNSSRSRFFTPISLYDPSEKTYSFAILTVDTYS